MESASFIPKDKEKAITETLKQFGCTEWYLFGSRAKGTATECSDWDIGVKGVPLSKTIRALSVLEMNTGLEIDLVNFDHSKEFADLIMEHGDYIKYECNA